MNHYYRTNDKRCKLEDIQSYHIAADEALQAAIRIVRYHAKTEHDAEVLRQLRAARKAIACAWNIVRAKHPDRDERGE